jgi:hypothetical protein
VQGRRTGRIEHSKYVLIRGNKKVGSVYAGNSSERKLSPVAKFPMTSKVGWADLASYCYSC